MWQCLVDGDIGIAYTPALSNGGFSAVREMYQLSLRRRLIHWAFVYDDGAMETIKSVLPPLRKRTRSGLA